MRGGYAAGLHCFLLHTGGELPYRSGMNTSRIAIGSLTAACLLVAAPSFAQRSFSPSKPASERPQAATAQEPPPALPGSRAEPTAVAPANRPALDMQPTDALFDAINRGDLPGAKDALNRGADINGHNVLGLTPLDLAIDLGRNNITFVLLSMRGPETSRPAPAATAAAKAAPRTAARRVARREIPQPQAELRRTGYTSATQAPRRFAGDGGAPNPSAGFLGFGATR